MNNTPLLKINNLTVTYPLNSDGSDVLKALDNISLKVGCHRGAGGKRSWHLRKWGVQSRAAPTPQDPADAHQLGQCRAG